jgi:hypothetical protein
MSLAYNSIGRPVSIQVTLKARGPVYPRTEEERRYQQYIEDEEPVEPSTFRPNIPTAPPRLRPTPYYPPALNVTDARHSLGKLSVMD